ncbi:hypothetical protein COW95_03440 [Candidatus Peregrinibacteria bacterium CG22_combo_CG10-13_8_21_14_all_49_11]|nr:MAG: hypothetical protein COW95_03440 [Candidatus Peregrinibacteria bacterium CG22_combo_CG10-13_8_21_14_all_49_11]
MNNKKRIAASDDFVLKLKVVTKEKEDIRRKLVAMEKKLKSSYVVLDALQNSQKQLLLKAKQLAVIVREKEYNKRMLEESQKATLNVLEDLEDARTNLEREMQNVRKFQLAVQASSDAIAITLPDMTYVYVNPAWSTLTGYSLQEVQNKTPIFLMSDTIPKALISHFFARNAEEEEEEEEAVFQSDQFIFKRKDGNEYDVEVTKYAIREKMAVTFYVTIHRDITYRKRMDRIKTEFVSLASHQLRSPLTEIRWALSHLKQEKLTDEQMTIVTNAHTASRHMADTIKSILIISNIDTGQIQPDPVDTKLHTIIDDVVRFYDVMQQKKNIRLNIDCPQNIHMHTDDQLLKEILSNLLSNAYKYTPDGGSVHIFVKQEKEYVNINVADTGYGIPYSEQKRVSEKFFRGSNIVDKEEEGNGIGLNMVYALVKRLGGTISFVSQKNKGTTFSFIIPFSL